MPYTINWHTPGRVLIEKAFGDISVEELVRFNEEVTVLIIEQGVAPVHVIVDLLEVGRYPTNLREIISAMRKTAPGKVGWMLVVTGNPILRFVASMVFQVARLKLRTYQTVEEALAFLNEVDESLAQAS